MNDVRQRLESTRLSSGSKPYPLSPTAFPGADIILEDTPAASASAHKVPPQPLFPDMRRDEYMSKSTISTKETASSGTQQHNQQGDYWSVSTASDEQYRHKQQHPPPPPQQYHNPMNNNNYSRPQHHHDHARRPYESNGYRDDRNYESRDHEIRGGRLDHSLERRTTRERPSDHQPLDRRPKSRPRGGRPLVGGDRNYESDEYTMSQHAYDDYDDDYDYGDYADKRTDRYNNNGEPFVPRENRMYQEGRLPQHMYSDDDDYGPNRRTRMDPRDDDNRDHFRSYHNSHRRERFAPRSPRIPSPRAPTTPTRGPRSERGVDLDYRRRAISPTRTDYAGHYADDDHDDYGRRIPGGRGRSKSPGNWTGSLRIPDERPRFHDDSSDDDEVLIRGRPTSRKHAANRETGKQYKPYRQRSKSRTVRYEEDDDDDDDERVFQFDVADRRSRRTVRYEEDGEDDSSVSSLNVERGTSRRLEAQLSNRDHSRGRSRTIEIKAQRKRSKSRDKKEPLEFVIDLSQPLDDDREVTFSPSTDVPRATSNTSASHGSEDHSKRIADANLMKEQSEARHQILKEIRQAMEMRDLTHDALDRQFWDRQVNTLNASLKSLWDTHIASNGFGSGSAEYLHSSQYANPIPIQTTVAPAVVNNYNTVKVQAPDNLPGGHQFTIRVNGKPMKAQVPSGGVRKGDVFTIRIPLNVATTPAAAALETIKVRAPASLPEGYRFTAKMGERTIVATVPPGGVQKGEIFSVPIHY